MDKQVRADKMCEVAWDFAGKIVSDEMSYEDLDECFGTAIAEEIFATFTYKEAMKRYVEWKNRSKVTFEIGDEVYLDCGELGVVVSIGTAVDDGQPVVMSYSGSQYGYVDKSRWHKTGRRYPEIIAVLESLCDNRKAFIKGAEER